MGKIQKKAKGRGKKDSYKRYRYIHTTITRMTYHLKYCSKKQVIRVENSGKEYKHPSEFPLRNLGILIL
jgi:hypothetical protein